MKPSAIGEARPFASLSSGLLARKGQAKPAMRPQGVTGGPDDLGWNDMGRHAQPSAPLPPTPPPAVVIPVPEVARQQAVIARELGVPVESAEPASAALPAGVKRAAFTLRLDRERHLKLRLAAALRGRSAQLLVTEALDSFLRTITDLDALAAGAARTAQGDQP